MTKLRTFIGIGVMAVVFAGTAQASIGYVGGSGTTQAVYGYQLEGGMQFPRPISVFDGKGTLGVYPGGIVTMWDRALSADSPWPYWDELAAMTTPDVEALWMQVGVSARDDVFTALAAAKHVVAELQRRYPQAVVYVSSMPPYAVPPANFNVGAANAVTNALVGQGLAERGPQLPTLQPQHLLADGVHMNDAGERLAGKTLRAFFDPGARVSGKVMAA